METIKTWQERMSESDWVRTAIMLPKGELAARDEEIADRRAAMAKKAEAAPVVAVEDLSEQQWRELCWQSIRQHHMLPDGIEQRIKGDVLAQRAASVGVQPVAWRENDDGWVYIDADSELGKHIAEYQKDSHGVSVFPLYTAPVPAATNAPDSGRDSALVELTEALEFYAEGAHFMMHDPSAWDTVSGEPSNFYEDESNTATVEDGSVAKMALEKVAAMAAQQNEKP